MINPATHTNERRTAGTFWFVALLLFATSATQTLAQSSPAPCREAHADALLKFRDTAYDEVITILQRCLDTGQPIDSMKVEIHALMSRAYLQQKNTVAATNAIHLLLDVDSTFAPDLTSYTTSYRNFFRAAKGTWQPKPPVIHVTDTGTATKKNDGKRGSKKWFYVGGGAVAAGVAAIIIFGPKDGEFPEPPDRPTK